MTRCGVRHRIKSVKAPSAKRGAFAAIPIPDLSCTGCAPLTSASTRDVQPVHHRVWKTLDRLVRSLTTEPVRSRVPATRCQMRRVVVLGSVLVIGFLGVAFEA